jgi:adenosine deaminase
MSSLKNDLSKIKLFFSDFILPNTKYTSIPSENILQLQHHVNIHNGFHDLHMHLNGALETDRVWQDYIANPKSVYKDLKQGFKNGKVREQLEQESMLLTPLKFVRLLEIAQNLRIVFFDYIFNFDTSFSKIRNRNQLLNQILKGNLFNGNSRHPFLKLIIKNTNKTPYLMSVEALMYVLILQELEEDRNGILANLFHFYLLILGLCNRLLVQQTHQNGFEQFQKITLNGLREPSELTYYRRFHQMSGNELRYLKFLEGRFSPKDNFIKSFQMFNAIKDGWTKLESDYYIKHRNNSRNPELKLVAHFIKRTDFKPNQLIRHKKLRYDLIYRGKILGLILKRHKKYRTLIVGIDAASSEFDTPPEVFAPLYRMMRKKGIQHFTYHAGEDFYHILDGIRAIYEAITFCGLKNGDRIGHATALGLSTSQWKNVVGNRMKIRIGLHLDNLVFCYHIITKNNNAKLLSLLPILASEIQKLGFQIYEKYLPASIFEKAWLMRSCCPIHCFGQRKSDIISKQIFSESEWIFPIQNGHISKRGQADESLNLFQMYHSKLFRQAYDEILDINPFEIFSVEQLQEIQFLLLEEMCKREIVIETLPTSNVRIGFHKNFETYHLKNWTEWEALGKSIPPIVIGSDDTGIFATNIFNEYANIYSTMIKDSKYSHRKAMSLIEKLEKNSSIYKFVGFNK